jgi:twitching motility protein PilI
MTLKPMAALERTSPSRKFLDQGHGEVAEQRYGFRIGDLGFLLGKRAQCEVVPVPKASRIPGTPDWVLGVMNLRGSLVPVFDLRRVFELPNAERQKTAVGLVLDRGDRVIATIADDYPRALIALELLPEVPPLPAALRPHVSAAYRLGTETWLEFDHRPLFTALSQRMAA